MSAKEVRVLDDLHCSRTHTSHDCGRGPSVQKLHLGVRRQVARVFPLLDKVFSCVSEFC